MLTLRSFGICMIVLGVLTSIVISTTTDSSTKTAPSQPSASSDTTTSTTTKTMPTGPTTPLTPAEECPRHNKSCKDCINAANYKCFYCYTDNSCRVYPIGKVLPTSECSLSEARWGVCWVNFEALIITMGVLGGIILFLITCCCVKCCCCRGGKHKDYMKEDAKWQRQKAERKQKSEDRKADRKQRMDEIRKKYGLMKDDTPYQRFDA